jgi:hypothetical protein
MFGLIKISNLIEEVKYYKSLREKYDFYWTNKLEEIRIRDLITK